MQIDFTSEEKAELQEVISNVNLLLERFDIFWTENKESHGFELHPSAGPNMQEAIIMLINCLMLILSRTQTELALHNKYSDIIDDVSMRTLTSYMIFTEDDPGSYFDEEKLQTYFDRLILED